jgi:formylglycine-generating enzyme required for sulfatase activity
MVLIPAGDFIMGSTEEEALAAYDLCLKEEGEYCIKEDYLAEYPQRKVYLNNFFIDKKEVSNEEYRMFVESTGHRPPLYWNNSNLNSSNQPVVGVSWDDANTYCQWLGKRLSTEEEWEKAARGTDGRKWSWGNDWDASKLNHGKGGMPGYDESDGYKYTAPVGVSLGVSSYGILNMAGNVLEWVADEFKPYPGNDKFLNEFGTPYKVMRGGSYAYGMADNRTVVRLYDLPEYRDEDVGFRCVK